MLACGIFEKAKLPELTSHIVVHLIVDDNAPGAGVSVPTDEVSQLVTTLFERGTDLVKLRTQEAQVIVTVRMRAAGRRAVLMMTVLMVMMGTGLGPILGL